LAIDSGRPVFVELIAGMGRTATVDDQAARVQARRLQTGHDRSFTSTVKSKA